jgi:hypothetical protein
MGGDDPAETADLELTIIDQNIAMLTPDPAERASRSRRVWMRRKAALGEHHLATLDALVSYASFSADAGTAYRLVTAACAGYRTMHPQLVALRVDCEDERASLAAEIDEPEVAQAVYSDAIAMAAPSSDPDLEMLRHLMTGELALLRGDRARAIESFQAVIRARADSDGWWQRKEAYRAELGTGLALAATGDRAAALPHLEAAVRGFDEIVRINRSISYRLRLERARSAVRAVRPERDALPTH